MATLPMKLALLLAPCALASQVSLADDGPAARVPRVLKTHFSYKATVPAVPNGAKTLKVWLPIPSDGDYQKVSNLKVVSPVPYEITTESKYGNRMVYVTAGAKPIEITVGVDVERQEVSLLGSGGKTAPKTDLARYLEADARVPVGGKYAGIGDTVVGPRMKSLEKMRAIFDHVVATMQYDYNKESPKLGQGDVAFVCDYKKGNCSDLHSYVISLARSEGVPAYLEFGFPLTGIPVPNPVPLTGKIGGYHCWTWFYDDEKGWLPLDASDGRRWLDAIKPEVKDQLVGSLVLERSAAAFSKGRDITLSPPQAAGPLNCFIYPYAEADGKPVEAKWELTYELLSSASGHQDMQGQIDELRRIIAAQAREIDDLKAARTASQKVPAVSVPTGEKVTVYGQLRTDVNHDSAHVSPNNQFPFFVQSPDNANVKGPNDMFTMTPRLTRLGLTYSNPGSALGWDVNGKIEIDFQNGGSESRPTPRARHAYVQLTRGTSSWLVGQTWDLISPLFPSPNDDSLMWNAGNLGDRRPQIRYTYDDGMLNWALAAGLTGAIDAKDLDNNGVRDGEDSGVPGLQGRIGWRGKQGAAGVWGHIATEKVTTAVAGETRFQSTSLGADFMWKLPSDFDFKGELWTGRNLSDVRGGIGQGVNATTGEEIMSRGGWGELGLQNGPRHRIAVGYTIDDPEDGDVPAGGRIKNDAWFLSNKWTLGTVEIGLNYLYWQTRYKGLSRGIDNRLNLYISHKF